jgi:hypothetical protein
MKRLFLFALFVLVTASFGGASASRVSRAWLPYPWPLKPFDRQHPVRGAFGDPRTLVRVEPFGITRPDDSGKYSFHTGIDIVGAPGTPVYPVVSGRVVVAHRHGIVVATGDGRRFAYWHLRGNVELGQRVVARRTVLGWIRNPFDHVHFSEIDNHQGQNPLARGHLQPYADHTTPRAVALDFTDGRSRMLTEGGVLSPNTGLAIAAVDEPALPVRGPFAGLPQTPALVQWRLRSASVRSSQTWGAWHVAADFRQIQPPINRFWDVYAAGTFQNSPVFDRRLHEGIAGLYLFRVALDTSQLRPGVYRLEARVADVRGNHSTTTWPLEIPRR